ERLLAEDGNARLECCDRLLCMECARGGNDNAIRRQSQKLFERSDDFSLRRTLKGGALHLRVWLDNGAGVECAAREHGFHAVQADPAYAQEADARATNVGADAMPKRLQF